MRLFVAFEIPEAVRRELALRVERARPRLPPARWVGAEALHLTLLFLGEVEADRVPGLAERLRAAFAPHAPLPLRVAGGGTFPPGRPARVAWAGIEAGAALPAIQLIQQGAVAAAVAAVGHEPEPRPFHPHVTLARCPEPWPREAVAAFGEALAGGIGEPFTAERGVLVESRLSPKGARYRNISELPLRGTVVASNGAN